MPSLKYPYSPDTFIDPKTKKLISEFRPYIPIRLGYRYKLGKIAVHCLLDSGADRNLFPALWGESLGINLKEGRITNHLGIGNYGIRTYTHKVTLFVGLYKIITEVDFSEHQKIPLLGRDTFFSFFSSIKFDQRNKEIELKY